MYISGHTIKNNKWFLEECQQTKCHKMHVQITLVLDWQFFSLARFEFEFLVQKAC